MLHEILESMDIHLLSAGHATVGREWNYNKVTSFYNRLFLVLDGEGIISYGGHDYPLTKGCLRLIPCYQTADYRCDDFLELHYISFTSRMLGGIDMCSLISDGFQRDARPIDGSIFEQLLELNPEMDLPVYNPEVELYRQYHKNQFEHYHERSARLRLENKSYVSLLLASFMDHWALASDEGDPARLRAFLQFVEENLSRPISAGDLSAHLGLAPNYLSDWLSKHYGFRPVEYINRRRIEAAQELLIATDLSMKELAHQLGFSSASYFNQVFKKKFRITPSRYRELNPSPDTSVDGNPRDQID
jgi:AraC-like DNA-binding protein